ncbi:LysR substrate-binding domain-containing protein [Vibrio vulnificus]|uniref:LysR substrate-binding domain-containing protein n=1 Tax=Vibrio vulnificus TaxID=672 RepID=UPI0021DA42FC|nr:LysR substrate-binding domain-containing protein [Vibrio vulnificus]EIU7058201.1 LysR family transcriptional regulator [Vibrio vulnificus]ELV8757268.1 LysR family transcriptional regulator [Vibrio vulnificus]MCU8300958.1 LysR substrate-binding domain-containing protein [Vibrio vulnificus]MDK2677151.1 LysR substrate-binding domain-containing protein [Vibrio vulnificus]MDK2686174.1 LysR substrate-binding domain-containing protein [Vibrio vulnificus]
MQNLPPLNALKAFEAAARMQSFTKAAEELNVTRAAVSQQVKALESLLEAVLFERHGAQLVLTEAARDYLPVVSNLFQQLAVTTDQLFNRRQNGQLVLHVAHSFCLQWLLPRLGDFRRRYPQWPLKISTTSNTLPDNSATADVEIINGYGDWQYDQVTKLTEENWILVASPGFLQLNPIATLDDLINVPRLATSGYVETWPRWFDYHEISAACGKMALEFDHSTLSIEAAVHQLGVLLVRDLLVDDHLRQGSLVQVGGWSMPSAGAHHLIVRNADKPQVDAFVHWLTDCCKNR